MIKFREHEIEKKRGEEVMKVISEKEEQHLREYKANLELKRKMGRYKLRRVGQRLPEIPKDDNGPRL